MSISFLIDGNINKFKEFSSEFFEKNSELKHQEMEMEMLMLSGFIYNFIGDIEMSSHYFNKAYQQAVSINKDFYKACSLCNLGVIDANKEMDDLFNSLELDEKEFGNINGSSKSKNKSNDYYNEENKQEQIDQINDYMIDDDKHFNDDNDDNADLNEDF